MRHLLHMCLFAVVMAGCSDNQATVDEESTSTVNTKKSKNDRQSNSTEQSSNDVDVDTIGMAEFLALKSSVAENYRKGKDLTDENDIGVDTTGFSAFKKSKAKTARRPCDCEDSLLAEGKDNNRNARASTDKRATQQSESGDEEEVEEDVEVAEDSIPVSRNQ